MVAVSEGTQLKLARISQGLTLKDLSRKTFLSPSHLYRMESSTDIGNNLKTIYNIEEGSLWFRKIIEVVSQSYPKEESFIIISHLCTALDIPEEDIKW